MKKIFLKDTCFAHCVYSNNPLPPIQFSDDIVWDRSGNFGDNDVVIYTDNMIPYSRGNFEKDVAWLIEPEELQPQNYEYVRRNNRKFARILTSDSSMALLEGARIIPYGGCWIKKEDQKTNYIKTKEMSIVASDKNALTGHKLRHEIIREFGDQMDVFGRGYNEIDYKLDALKDYFFHVVIENVKKDFWFTEKLIDALVTGCIPIYYGCPSIGKFFNTDGFIIIDSKEDFLDAKKMATSAFYLSRSGAIQENFERAKRYVLAEKWISELDFI